jgi:hypothetical protein
MKLCALSLSPLRGANKHQGRVGTTTRQGRRDWRDLRFCFFSESGPWLVAINGPTSSWMAYEIGRDPKCPLFDVLKRVDAYLPIVWAWPTNATHVYFFFAFAFTVFQLFTCCASHCSLLATSCCASSWLFVKFKKVSTIKKITMFQKMYMTFKSFTPV